MSIRFPNLGITLDHVIKSIQVFGYEITIYGILAAVGMILGISFIVLEAKRRGQEPNLYLWMILVSLLFGVIGARLFYVGFNWSLYRGNIQEILNIRNGGMSIYGALLGGVLGAQIFCKLKKTSFWQMADTACIGLLIGQIIGRWGDFFNRESFGEYTDSYFAMQLPLASVQTSGVSAKMRENLMVIDGVNYIQVHPVFLYESILCFLLLLFLLFSRRKKKFQGEVFMRYLSLYGLIRCFTEWLRTDKILIPGTRISVSFVISVFLFLFFGMEAMIRRSMEKKRAAARRRRKEAFYSAEEQAEAELDRQEEERARAEAAKKAELEQAAEREAEEEEWDGTLPSERRKQEEEDASEAADPVSGDPDAPVSPEQQDTQPGGSAEEPGDQSEAGPADEIKE